MALTNTKHFEVDLVQPLDGLDKRQIFVKLRHMNDVLGENLDPNPELSFKLCISSYLLTNS